MNNDTPRRSTYAHSQLDENIRSAVREILYNDFSIDQSQLENQLFDIIKRNIQGNVNWNIGS